jgi:hypothetical protein
MGDQIKKNKMDGACGMNGRQVRCIQGFDGKNSEKRPLGRLRTRWEAYIKMDLQEVGWRVGGWAGLAWLKTGAGGGRL